MTMMMKTMRCRLSRAKKLNQRKKMMKRVSLSKSNHWCKKIQIRWNNQKQKNLRKLTKIDSRLNKMERITQQLMLLLIHNLKIMMIKKQNLSHLTKIRNKVISLFQVKLQKLQRKLLKKTKKLKKLKNLRTHKSKLKKKIYLITLHLFKPM